jgi:hypothetical protein
LDDRDQSFRFIPEWIGKGPANGGKFKSETIELIDELIVGNRIQIDWLYDGFLRIIDAKIIKPPHTNGIFVGYIMKMSQRWIDVQNIDERRPWRFYLPWIGGYPEEGGGYDPKILTRFKTHEPTDPIRFSWVYKDRPTIVSTYDTVRDATVPFWLGKKIEDIRIRPKRIAPDKNKEQFIENKAPATGSPFDMIVPNGDQSPVLPKSQANPFDMSTDKPVKEVSPFDQMDKSVPATTPFDPMKKDGDADKTQANPFDMSTDKPVKEVSPFDQMDKSVPATTPFDPMKKDGDTDKTQANPFDMSTDKPVKEVSPFDQMDKSVPATTPFDPMKKDGDADKPRANPFDMSTDKPVKEVSPFDLSVK